MQTQNDAQVWQSVGQNVENVLADMELSLCNARGSDDAVNSLAHKMLEYNGAIRETGKLVESNVIPMVCRRLDGYLSSMSVVDDETLMDLQQYVDTTRKIVTDLFQEDEKELEAIITSLPESCRTERIVKPKQKTNDDSQKSPMDDVYSVLLVLPNKTSQFFFERELKYSGLEAHSVSDAMQALEDIAKNKPDMVIISAELSPFSGVDLACALRAMPSTKHTLLAILTSYDPASKQFAELPENTPIIRKSHMDEDLAALW